MITKTLALGTLGLVFGLASTGHSEETCAPKYELKYESCASPTHGLTEKHIAVKNVLVNKGADKVSIGLCNEHIQTLVSEYFEGRNVTVTDWRAPDEPLKRGLTDGFRSKKDVYCDYELDYSEPIVKADNACPIAGVAQTADCYKTVDATAVTNCVNIKPKTPEELWTQTACLLDASSSLSALSLSPELYNQVTVKLDMIQKYLTRNSSYPGFGRLLEMMNAKK